MKSRAVQDEMLACLPNVRAFAISLCGNVDRADDLVQETVLKAWRHLDTYAEGTNMRAWMFTILRNVFISELRHRRVAVVSLDAEPGNSGYLSVRPEQHGWMDGKDMERALAMLRPDQREAIILVGAEGLSYEEAAAICACPVGTIKSRVNRARSRLVELLDVEFTDEMSKERTAAPAATPFPARPATGPSNELAPCKRRPRPTEAAA
jgi:RNA polymerase sigma-70 factor, ECF subfamily